MKRSFLTFCFALSAILMVQSQNVTQYVNPLMGTTTLWTPEDLGYIRTVEKRPWGAETYPGAALPNAMVQLTPVTMYRSGSGYQSQPREIRRPRAIARSSATRKRRHIPASIVSCSTVIMSTQNSLPPSAAAFIGTPTPKAHTDRYLSTSLAPTIIPDIGS